MHLDKAGQSPPHNTMMNDYVKRATWEIERRARVLKPIEQEMAICQSHFGSSLVDQALREKRVSNPSDAAVW